MQPAPAARHRVGPGPQEGTAPAATRPCPDRGHRLSLKGHPIRWLCCLLVLTGLSGSAAQTAYPIPQSSSGPGDTASDSAAVDPALSGGPGAGLPVESPDGGAGIPTEAPPPDNSADGEPPSSPGGAELLTVTPALDATRRVPLGAHGSWHLVFDDEFETLNTASWTPYWFNDCSPKSVMNNVKTCSSNVTVANGEAVLQLADAGSGALLSTNPRDGVPGHVGFEFTSGFVEARIYFPGSCSSTVHNWTAWWTVGQKFPHTGEIDIAEALAGDMWSVYHSAEGSKNRKASACWAGAYHTYGLHRKAGTNDIYYDGRLVHSYATSDGGSPHYLLLNVGVSAGSQVFGERGSMRVDYVRAWQ